MNFIKELYIIKLFFILKYLILYPIKSYKLLKVYLYKKENPDSEIFEYYDYVDINQTEKSCYLPTKKKIRRNKWK